MRQKLKDIGHGLHLELQPYAFVDDHTFLTRRGMLGMMFSIGNSLSGRTPDSECMMPGEVELLTNRFEAALRVFTDRFHVYQYLRKVHVGAIAGAPCERRQYLESKGLYRYERTMAVLYNPERAIIPSPLHASGAHRAVETRLQQSKAELAGAGARFSGMISDFLSADVLNKHETFQFLRSLLNSREKLARTVRLRGDNQIGFQAGDSDIEVHRDHVRIGESVCCVLTLKSLPPHTACDYMRVLHGIDMELTVCQEWRGLSPAASRDLVQGKLEHFRRNPKPIRLMAGIIEFLTSMFMSKSSSTTIHVERDDSEQEDGGVKQIKSRLSGLQGEMEDGLAVGELALTVLVSARDLRTAKEKANLVWTKFADAGMTLYQETRNSGAAWLATTPGNLSYQVRRKYCTTTNAADLSFVFAPSEGQRWNSHLNAEALATFTTRQRTPYYFNAHDRDVGHKLTVGKTGSGKTFTMNFLLGEGIRKYHPDVTILDMGGQYNALVRDAGGETARIGISHNAFQINPFSLALDEEGETLTFLFSFMLVLLETKGYVVSEHGRREISDAIQQLYMLPPSLRRLQNLALGPELRGRLSRWIEGGQYGTLFDNSENTLSFQAAARAIDFEGLRKYPEILEPMLFYVLHYTSRAHLMTSGWKLFVIDEAWRFFTNQTIRDYVIDALKRWRFRNASIWLVTQSVGSDMGNTDLLRVVAESVGTMLLLPNEKLNPEEYRTVLGLNDVQIEQVRKLTMAKESMVVRQGTAKILVLDVGANSDSATDRALEMEMKC